METKVLIAVTQNENGEQLVSGRELHGFLEVKTPYKKWFARMCEYGFVENVDFVTVDKNVYGQNGQLMPQKETDHVIKLSMAKELSMIQRTDRGKQARLYFIECEKQLNMIGVKERLLLGLFSKDPMVVANSHKQLVAIELKPLQEKIEQDKPLVEFANQVSSSSDSILVRQFAKLLADENIKLGEKKLYQWFRDNEYVCKTSTEPTQKAINQHLFEIVERIVKTPYGEKLTQTTKVTGKGQIFFTEKLRKLRKELIKGSDKIEIQ